MVAREKFDDQAVLMVACGFYHTAVVTEGGGVYTFGNGTNGQLGHGDEEDQLVPRRVMAGFNGERVVMVATGCEHTVALSEEGHVFTWGSSANGQLGHDDQEEQLAPWQVEAGRFGGEKVVFVAAGSCHTVAVTAGGRLYTWGYDYYGQLGHAQDRLVPLPYLLPTLVGAGVMAACGRFHTLVVTEDGAMWACGCATCGQLGLGNVYDKCMFERVEAGKFGSTKIVAAAAGGFQSAAVTEDGKLWTWGDNEDGQLGHGGQAPLTCNVPRCVRTKHSKDIQKMLLRSHLWNTLPDDVQKKIFIMSVFRQWTGRVKLQKPV